MSQIRCQSTQQPDHAKVLGAIFSNYSQLKQYNDLPPHTQATLEKSVKSALGIREAFPSKFSVERFVGEQMTIKVRELGTERLLYQIKYDAGMTPPKLNIEVNPQEPVAIDRKNVSATINTLWDQLSSYFESTTSMDQRQRIETKIKNVLGIKLETPILLGISGDLDTSMHISVRHPQHTSTPLYTIIQKRGAAETTSLTLPQGQLQSFIKARPQCPPLKSSVLAVGQKPCHLPATCKLVFANLQI